MNICIYIYIYMMCRVLDVYLCMYVCRCIQYRLLMIPSVIPFNYVVHIL